MSETHVVTFYFIGWDYEYRVEMRGENLKTLYELSQRDKRPFGEGGDFEFSIFARHLETKKWASVANHQIFLSEVVRLVLDDDDDIFNEFEEKHIQNSWIESISYRLCWLFVGKVWELLRDTQWLRERLEPALDEDRLFSEWNDTEPENDPFIGSD